MIDNSNIMSHEIDGFEKELRSIWDLVKNNDKLRDGEKASILKNLNEINFLWKFSK